jgi:hypothetical protein
MVERRGHHLDEHIAASGSRIGDVDDLEVGKGVVATVASGANCEHGRQR